jgi:competence protein ComEA
MDLRGALSFLADRARASPGEVGLLALLGALLFGGTALFVLRTPETPPPAVERTAFSEEAVEAAEPSLLMVHVAGAVKSPGVYELPDGSRVTDAVSAAGGAASDADLDALNLAALLTDGLKIYVPKVGEAPPQNVAGEGSSIVNLNTASAAELEELPGIGPVLAQRIIDFRTKRGRFTSVRQLMEVDGIGPKKFESLEDLVTV